MNRKEGIESKIMEYNKKGQVTIFIILAVIIIVFGILIYMFYPQIKSGLGVSTLTPQGYIQDCLQDELTSVVENVSSQGGSLSPEHYFLYQDQRLEYLCYTEENYVTCVVQQPMLYRHVFSEIERGISQKTKECFDSLKQTYESKGYQVSMKSGTLNVDLIPKRVILNANYSLTLTNQGSSEQYDNLKVVLNNNLYDLLGIANSIIGWETKYGDAETTAYMTLYPNIKVEKLLQTDGTTVYIITERSTRDKFQFASRSVAWPPGY